MNIYFDTEFVERGPDHPIHFVSIGMVAEDGRELYAVNADMDQNLVRTHPFVGKYVWPQLPLVEPRPGTRGGTHRRLDTDHPDVRPRAQIARLVLDFVRATPEAQLWAYYSAYDEIILRQLFGTMVDQPQGLPGNVDCLRQEAKRLGNPPLPYQSRGEHHALEDARHDVKIHHALREAS